jgi:hypothetical protein
MVLLERKQRTIVGVGRGCACDYYTVTIDRDFCVPHVTSKPYTYIYLNKIFYNVSATVYKSFLGEGGGGCTANLCYGELTACDIIQTLT